MAGVLVHEWISRTGGSEKVLDAMASAFPGSPVVTLWNDDATRRYPGRRVTESWMARTPLRRSKFAALPLMPATWRHLPGGPVDWALISSHLFAHHASFAHQRADFRKYVYVHTPARYIWTPQLDRRGDALLPRAAAMVLRPLDRHRALEAHAIAANSEYVRTRIGSTWDRESTVIHPPVDVREIQEIPRWDETLSPEDRAVLDSLPADYLLGASRFVSYKRLDAVILAGELTGRPVVLAGSGPLREHLMSRAEQASIPVRVIDHPSDRLLYALYERALVYVFPAVEDFGIMPVEAMAAGTPVVAAHVGGASESVLDGVTGSHWDLDPSSLRDAVDRAARCAPEDCRARARTFSRQAFQQRLLAWMGQPSPLVEGNVGGSSAPAASGRPSIQFHPVREVTTR